jgi:hypothetical protein
VSVAWAVWKATSFEVLGEGSVTRHAGRAHGQWFAPPVDVAPHELSAAQGALKG